MLQLPIPNVVKQNIPCTICAHGLAVLPGWLSFITVNVQAYASWLPEIKLYENLTYVPHVACSYDVKLQRKEYTERHITDKKNSIQLTSVGFARARPIKMRGVVMRYYL